MTHLEKIKEKATNVVCSYYKVSKADIFSRKRKEEIRLARQVVQYLLVKYRHDESYGKIGYLTGVTNQATIIHSIKTINNMLETDKDFNRQFYSIEILFNNKEYRPLNLTLDRGMRIRRGINLFRNKHKT